MDEKNEEYHACGMLAICILLLWTFLHRTLREASEPNELLVLYLSRKRGQKRGSSISMALKHWNQISYRVQRAINSVLL